MTGGMLMLICELPQRGLVNGLAELHNACKAYSPAIKVIGNNPATHKSADAVWRAQAQEIERKTVCV